MRVCITIPVFNEEVRLRDSITRLHGFLSQHLSTTWEIVIADNGSTDGTLHLADSLRHEYANVLVTHSDEKGRGGALKRVWLRSGADILSYMDADLSTELEAIPPLIEALAVGGYDIATGSRLLKPALTSRGFKREFASRGYNRLVKALLRTSFSDAQCGFKAITRQAAQQLLPLIEDTGWFFDTELLATAEKMDYRIFDLPVRWIENRDSHVKVLQTAIDDIRGLLRLRRRYQNGLPHRPK